MCAQAKYSRDWKLKSATSDRYIAVAPLKIPKKRPEMRAFVGGTTLREKESVRERETNRKTKREKKSECVVYWRPETDPLKRK